MHFIFFFSFSQKIYSQDSLYNQDFAKGIPASSLTALAGDQSVMLSWASATFPTGTVETGYLLIYATSAPSLVNDPNGLSPDFAVLNGTVVPLTETNLPDQPATNATANGLTNGVTYNFLIVAYIWDGVHSSSYQYSSSAGTCITIPPDGPNNLSLQATASSSVSITGSFTEPLFKPDGYMVIYSSNNKLPSIPPGNVFQTGGSFGSDTVALISSSTSFSTSSSGYNLSPSTTYYIFVFSYSLSACNGMPVYSTEYVMDSIATPARAEKAAIMLDYFTAAKANGYNSLTWKAAASASLLTFTAERSDDSVNFTDIYTVSAGDTAEDARAFNYNDYTKSDAALYYRIKITDSSRDTAYSNIAAIRNQKNIVDMLQMLQNPVRGNALLKISSPACAALELVIVNIEGREVARTSEQVQAGSSLYYLNTAGLAKGIYVVKGIFPGGVSNATSFIMQ